MVKIFGKKIKTLNIIGFVCSVLMIVCNIYDNNTLLLISGIILSISNAYFISRDIKYLNK